MKYVAMVFGVAFLAALFGYQGMQKAPPREPSPAETQLFFRKVFTDAVCAQLDETQCSAYPNCKTVYTRDFFAKPEFQKCEASVSMLEMQRGMHDVCGRMPLYRLDARCKF